MDRPLDGVAHPHISDNRQSGISVVQDWGRYGPAMPTNAEVRAQLTGPGGMFEVVTEDVLGRPTEVYASRMPSLRSVAEVGLLRGDDQTFIVYGDRTYGFGTFVRDRQRRRPRPARPLRARPRATGWPCCRQNNPEWCLTFWATVSQGAILVGLNGWWTTDEIEYGLQDSGAKVLVADQKRFERIAGSLDEAPDLEHVFLVDCTPADVGLADDPRLHDFSELTGSPTAEFVDAGDRRGRLRGHLLHVGHHRAGRRAPSRRTAA